MKRIQCGTDMIFKKASDFKIAYVFLQEGHTFRYPEVFSRQSLIEMEEDPRIGDGGGVGEEQPQPPNYANDWLGLD